MSRKPSMDGPTTLVLIETAYMILEREPPESDVWQAANEYLNAQDALLRAIHKHQAAKPNIVLPGAEP